MRNRLSVDELENAFTERIAAFVATRPGVTLETEMAGDWNSLGVVVTIPGGSTDREIFDLGNDLLAALQEATAEISPPFSWSAGIYRGTELLTALGPDSHPEWMCEVCCHQQDVRWGDTCTICGAARVP